MASIAEVIEEQVAGRSAEEVLELILDDCKCKQLTGLTGDYVNLEKLSASECELKTLKGFPSFPNLRKLNLMTNELTGADLKYLAGCTGLTHLLLCGNNIKDLASLEPLKGMKSLQKLDLTGCEVSELEGYREKVFEMLDQLVFLDGADKEGQEDEDDSDLEDGDLDGEEDEEGEGSEDEDDDEEAAGAGADDDDEDDEDEDGENDDEDAHERGVKRKHDDEEDA